MVIKLLLQGNLAGKEWNWDPNPGLYDSKARHVNHSSLMGVKRHKKSPSYLVGFLFSSTFAKISHPLYRTSLETLTLSKIK